MRHAPTEIWKITTKADKVRYYYWPRQARRAFSLPAAEAELLLGTEQARLVDKPEWVGRNK